MATMNATEPVLTDAEIAQFWDQGFLLIKGVLTREEAAYYRNCILDLLPRDLTIPAQWGANAGRLKPINRDGSQTFDTPEFLPLLMNEKVYRVAVQLLGSSRLRVSDGSLGITLRNASGDDVLSQRLHLDASVPPELPQFHFTPQELQVGGCYYLSDVEPTGGGIHVVPGGHKIVEERARGQVDGRQQYHRWKQITDMPESIEVTGEAGDFALLHHLMPHAASHNRLPRPRVAQFTRHIREDHAHYAGRPPATYNSRQLVAMTPLGRQLLGLEPW